MSRAYLTNDGKFHESSLEVNGNAGLEVNGQFNSAEFWATAYDKRAIDTTNYCQFEEDFIATTGTLIYDGKVGYPALKRLYEDFEGDITTITERAVGNYAVFLKQGDDILVFNDPNNLYSVYYYQNDSKWLITTSLHSLAATLRDTDDIAIDTHKLYESLFELGEVGRRTKFEDVRSLVVGEHLRLKRGELTVTEHGYERSGEEYEALSFHDAIDSYADALVDISRQMQSAFDDDVAIHMTGGKDTRTILAGLLDVGVRPRLMYGDGDSQTTGANQDGFEIIEQLGDKYGLDSYRLNWKGNHLNHGDDIWRKYFERYGFNYSVRGCTPNFFKEYEGEIPDYPSLVLDGHGPWSMNPLSSFIGADIETIRLDDFTTQYFMNDPFEPRILSRHSEYIEHLRDELRTLKETCYDPGTGNGFNRKEAAKFKFFLEMMDGIQPLITLHNEFSYFVTPLALPELADPLLQMPPEYKNSFRFQMELIRKFDTSLVNLPIVSGGESMTYNASTQTLSPMSEQKVWNWIIAVYEVAPAGVSALFSKVYNLYNTEEDDDSESPQIDTESVYTARKPYLSECDWITDIDFQTYQGSPAKLQRMFLLCKALDYLSEG